MEELFIAAARSAAHLVEAAAVLVVTFGSLEALLKVVVVMSWAAAGRSKAASPRPTAPISNTSLGMEAPERPKVILIIPANAGRKRLAFGL